MTKKFLASCLVLMITNLLQILAKKSISLILFFFHKTVLIYWKQQWSPLTNHITDRYLANIEFTKADIKIIICKLELNKAHGHDMISICMLKMSGTPQLNQFSQLFKNWLKCGIFPVDLKKGNTESTNKTSKTFVQSLFFQSAAKLLNVSC